MEKRNRKAGHSYSLRDRILAQIMVIIVTLTMIPFDSLVAHAATTTNVKSIGSIQTEYEVDYGTSKDDIGLPSELSVILETAISSAGATNGGTEYSEDAVDESVSWEGYYDGDTPGTYALTAEFDDGSLYYDDMPTVKVTVREPETAPGSNAGDEGDDDEDPDQPVVTGETEGQSTENSANRDGQMEPGEQADYNFGDDPHVTTMSFSISDTANRPCYAGDTFNYNFEGYLFAPATYRYDISDEALRMYDEWKNLHYTIKLPQGVSPVEGSHSDNVSEVRLIDAAQNLYDVILDPANITITPQGGIYVNASIGVMVDDNGVVPAGTVLPAAEAEFFMSFDCYIDRNRTQTRPYTHSKTASTEPITLDTPDEWKLTKHPYNGTSSVAYSIEGDEVTVHYLVRYGLLVGDLPSDDPEVYKRPGRVPFDPTNPAGETYTGAPRFKDDPTLTLPNGTQIDPLRMTITPIEAGYVYLDGTSADDSAGNPIGISVEPGAADGIEIPYATVPDDDETQMRVDKDAPAYSQYYVDVVYDYDEFQIWYYSNPDNVDALSENTAHIDYRLAGLENDDTEGDAETTIPAYIPPAQITIQKKLVNYDSNNSSLYTEYRYRVEGPAKYKITKADGSAPTIYYLDSEGKYQPIGTNIVTIDPGAAASTTNSNTGEFTFYLDAGQNYVIEEIEKPTNTDIAADDTLVKTVENAPENTNTPVEFRNKEILGKIEIEKVDDTDNENSVDGAVFGLFYDEACTQPVKDANGNDYVVETVSGKATFERLIPDTYHVKEISAPDGYTIIATEQYKEADVTAGVTKTVKVINHVNSAVIKLVKKYKTVIDSPTDDWRPVTSDFKKFDKKFTLQQSADNGATWTDFRTNISIDNRGASPNIPVPEVDETTGNKFMYRFVEVIPSGYFAEDGSTGDDDGKAYSSAITPADLPVNDRFIEMRNLMGGKITLSKYRIGMSTNAATYGQFTTPVLTGNKEFDLYYVEEGSTTAVFVAHGKTANSGTNNGKLTFEGLVSQSNGHTRTYYVVETNCSEKDTWGWTDTINTTNGEKNALLVGSFTNNEVLTKDVYNYTTAVPFWFIKKDSLTDEQLEGCTIHIVDTFGDTRDVTTKKNAEAISYARVGGEITFTETQVPSGYYLDPTAKTIDTSGWEVKLVNGVAKVVDTNNNDAEVTKAQRTITFTDAPYPKVTVQKKRVTEQDSSVENGEVYDKAIFKFYTYSEEDGYVPYTFNGNAVSVVSDGKTSVNVDPGVYWLHEENCGTDVINPDVKHDLYTGMGQYSEDDEMFFFGPYTVNAPTTSDNIEQMIPSSDGYIINISNKANLTVNKKYFDVNKVAYTDPLKNNGFSMQLYRLDKNGNEVKVGKPVATGNKTSYGDVVNGQAVFENLPVYDSDGNKIQYFVREVVPDNAKYDPLQRDDISNPPIAGETAVCTLTSGDTSKPSDATNAGEIWNITKPTAQVTKKYKDMRENDLIGTTYNLQEAVIALYAKKADGTYEFYGTMKTSAQGQATFVDIPYEPLGYVGIEVSIPDKPEYEYMVPVDLDNEDRDLKLLIEDYDTPPASLTESEIAAYNYKELTYNESLKMYTATLWNQIPWTQIHITKYWKIANNTDDTAYVPLDGTDFTLYKQVLPEDTPVDAALTFNASDPSVTEVGTYTSGSWLVNGQEQTGELQTDVLDNADNIVYWVVETRPTPGYRPAEFPHGSGEEDSIILFHREGTSYTNNSVSIYEPHKPCTRDQILEDNKVNYDKVHNWTGGETPGEGYINIAYIKFSKWGETNGNNYELLPNATFELWAVKDMGEGESPERVKLLDTITTGDENLVIEGDTTGHGVSVAIDAWDLYDELSKKYSADELSSIMWFRVHPDGHLQNVPDSEPYVTDGTESHRRSGTFYLNATLKEVAGPAMYTLDTHYHNLLITFPTGDFELGNDKYFVTDIDADGVLLCNDNGAGTEETAKYNDYQHVAIVDPLAKNHPVTFRHFGYDPAVVGKEMSHKDLLDALGTNGENFVDKEVTFRLERYDEINSTAEEEIWNPWHFNPGPGEQQGTSAADEIFSCSGNGFTFPDGLIDGDYRVIMETPAEGYENFYTEATPFYFTVRASSGVQVFTTFSPEKPDLTINKISVGGVPVTGKTTFKLDTIPAWANVYPKTADAENGNPAVFEDLGADRVFYIEETASPAGYTNRYFKELFKETYKDKGDLVNLVEKNTGYAVSYATTTADNEEGQYVPSKSSERKLVEETVIVDKDYLTDFTLTVKNAKLVNLEISKVNAQDLEEYLGGAVFSLYFKPFENFEEHYTVPTYTDGDSSWIMIGNNYKTAEEDDLDTPDVDETGKVLVQNLEPGVYHVKEETAPGGFDLNTEGKTIVITGGMNIPDLDPNSDDYDLYTGEGGKAEVTVENMPKTGLKVQKVVEFGDYPETPFSFRFVLKDAQGNAVAGNPDTATKDRKAEFKELIQGGVYYLMEVAQAGYKIKEVKVNGQTVTAESTGDFKNHYKITMPNDGTGVEVVVTNIRMEAQVDIFKYDGETGEGLTGAQFEVRKVKDDPESVVAGATITEDPDIPGKYLVVIPMDNTKQTYYIHETAAPISDYYVIDPLHCDITVTDLEPGQTRHYTFNGIEAQDNEYVLPNYVGARVKVAKYGGLQGQESTTLLQGAELQIYFRNPDDPESTWNTWNDPELTDENGSAEFIVLEGYEYAIAETNDVGGYIGLNNVIDKNGTSVSTDTVDGRTIFIIGSDFDNDNVTPYEYTAYNLPYLSLVVNKVDVTEPSTVIDPNVTFVVCEVPNTTATTLTRAECLALVQQAQAQGSGYRFISDHTTNSTYSNNKFLIPGKKYLAVELTATDTGSTGTGDYSIILDDSRVVSYEVFDVPLTGYKRKQPYEVTFKNVQGSATVTIDKTVDKTKVDSLVTAPANVVYTLTPGTVDNAAIEYALDSYVITDTGLKVTDPESGATLADEWYTFTNIKVGSATMDTSVVGTDAMTDYPIKAIVTFYDFNGDECGQTEVNVSNNTPEVNVSEVATSYVKSFTIEYIAKSDNDAENFNKITGYALGQHFHAEPTLVSATVFEQEQVGDESITEIKKFQNDVEVDLKYTPSKSDGTKDTQKTEHDDSFAITETDSVPAPRIAFTKHIVDEQGVQEQIGKKYNIGDKITYTLKVENVSPEEAVLTNPVVVDLLPKGVIVDIDTEYMTFTAPSGITQEAGSPSTGYAGESQYVLIEFNGELAKGEAIEIKLEAEITSATALYGTTFTNYAFTTSTEVGVATEDNKAGAVIQDPEGAWASPLESIADALDVDPARAGALKEALDEYGDHGFLGGSWYNTWEKTDGQIAVKAQRGPNDSAWKTEDVARLENDENDEAKRTMKYQLTVLNPTTDKRTNLAVMDVMPTLGDWRLSGDTRKSEWSIYFKGPDVDSVMVNGEANTDYTIYYFTGDATQYNGLAAYTNVLADAKSNSLDSSWTTTYPGDNMVTAFILVFDYDPNEETATTTADTVVLEPTGTIQIEYTATTPFREADDLNPIVFKNAVNDFNYGYKTIPDGSTANHAYGNSVLDSNTVEVTITPPEVMVGGDVWIDADDNGEQDDSDAQNQSWYLRYDIVQELAAQLGAEDKITLNTSNRRSQAITETSDDNNYSVTGSDAANYGISHFEFHHLIAAKLKEGRDNYTNWVMEDLVGANPYTHNIDIIYDGNTFYKTINVVNQGNELTHGRGSYSPEPDVIPEIQKKDDNFINVTRGSAYKSEWFFLHQTTNKFDMTKDVGFNVPRTLKLQKKDKNGNGVNGAKFDVWGPFEVQEDGPFEDPAERVFDDDHYVGEYPSKTVDGVDGMVVIEGLKFFKEYVIVEKEAPEGYSINGATAEGPVEEIDISSENLYEDDYAAWLYTVPDTGKRPNDDGDIIDTVTVTDPDLIKIRPVKVWNDNDDPYGVRPASIFVQLYTVETNDQGEEVLTVAKDNSGEDVSAIELKSDNNYGANEPYTYWENLPKYNSDSEEIVYTIKEYVAYTNEQTNTPLAGYTASEPELVEDVITITNTPPYTQLTVNKEWEGDTGAAVGNIGDYIKSVTFKVQRKVKGTQRDPEDFIVNGNPLTCVVERGDGDQYNTYTFSNLPAKSASGDEYEYSAKEVSMIVVDSEGNTSAGDLSAYTFTHTASGTTVTFTNTLKKGKLQFFKDWDDENDQDGVRPDSVTLSVTADATDYFDGYSATVILNEDNEWGHDSDNPVELEVPVKDAKGNTITYTIVETPVPAGYTVKYVVNGGAEADSASATVVENEVTTVKAINKHEPNVIKVIATKDWNDEDDLYGERPKGEDASITFTLYADNEPASDQDGNDISVQTIRPDENGDWPNAEWDNLPEKKDGELIVYTVEETEITGYTTEYDPEGQVIVFENNVGTITVINTPIPTSLHIKKTWANEIDEEDVNQASLIKSVTFTIQKSVKDEDNWSNVTRNNDVYTKTLDRDGATFVEDDVTGLPKYNSEGQELEYRAVETSMRVEDLEGNVHNVDINGDIIGAYNMVVNPTGSNITEITNSFIKGWLKVKKIWVDNNDRDGIRPQSLTITITEDSDFIDYTGTIVLDDHNHWGADLEAIELPVKNLDGTDITYTITEEAVTGYTPEYEITVDGVKVSEGEAVTGTTTLTEDKTTEDTYTNTHEPETTSKTVTKFWDDENDLYGNRPETITFALYRTYDGLETPELVTVDDDGVELDNPTVVSKNNDGVWTYTWTNLPVYLEGQAGTAITYSVAETEINEIPVADFYGYTVTADGDTIINTPVTTGLDIYKYWDANELSCIADTVTEVKFKVQKSIDGTNFDDVEYTADGTTHVLETSIVKTNGTWGSAEVNGLPAYDPDNNPYTYRAKEIAIKVNGEWVEAEGDTVGGYNISQEDTPGANTPAPAIARDLSEITNTPIRGQLGVKKVWEDQDNAYNTRPGNITVTLEAEANGVAITGLPTSTVLNDTNGWEDTTTWGAVPVKDAAGNDIEYTFTEPTTGNYKAYVTVTSEEEGNTGTTTISEGSLTEITFTNKLITTSFNVEKKFPDETNGDLAYFVNRFKSQIKSIKVRLQRQEGENWIDVLNNNAVVEVDLNEQNGWKYTWENLPKNYADGNLIQYRAIEVSYTTANGTHEVTYTSADHQESGTVAAFNYTSTTVAAVGDDIATTTINNSIKVGRLVAFKIWDDDNDRDDLRPEDITFHLFCNGEQLPADVYDRKLKAITDEAGVAHDDQTTVPMEDENNYVVWTTLPVLDVDGINYKYSYSEKLGSGSAANPPQYSIIKSIMNIFLADNEDADAVDPTEDIGDGTTEGGAAGGEGSGNAQTGYAVEIEDSTGDYTATVDVELPTIIIELSDVITKVTNTHEPLVTEMSVKKEWEGNFIYGDHPKKVIVYLRAKYEDNDGNIIDELAQPEHKDHKFVNPVTLNEENNWEYTWTDLPVNKTGYVGHEITYYVVEEPVPNGFELDPDKQEMIREVLEHIGSVDVFTSKFTVVNTMLTTSLEVNKEWIDEEPAIAEKIKSVSFKVQRSIDDGTTWMDLVITDPEDEGQEAGQVVILTIDKEETTAYIDNLPTHSAEGDAYLYRAVEIGYTLKDGTFVKVKYDENTETSGTVGAYNYTSETINPGEGTDPTEPTEPTEPELPQRGEAGDGTEGPGETPETTEGYVTNVTNKTIRGAIKVTKTWKNDSDNNRPKSLKIQLTTFAGKNKITLKGIKYSTELTSANNWTDTTTWEKVPVLDEYGNKIIYMLEEPEVNRYSASYQIVYNNKELESGSSRAFSTDVYENGVIEGRLINRYNPPANKTGDDAPLAAAGGALAVGLAGLAAVLARKKRRV